MGCSRNVYVTVSVVTDNGYWTPQEWRVRARGAVPAHGAPTAANLAKWVEAMEASTQPGGVNAHVGTTTILSAKICDTRREHPVLATYEAV